MAGARTLLMPKMKVSFAEFDRLLALRSDAHAVCPASLELHGLTAGYYEEPFSLDRSLIILSRVFVGNGS